MTEYAIKSHLIDGFFMGIIEKRFDRIRKKRGSVHSPFFALLSEQIEKQ